MCILSIAAQETNVIWIPISSVALTVIINAFAVFKVHYNHKRKMATKKYVDEEVKKIHSEVVTSEKRLKNTITQVTTNIDSLIDIKLNSITSIIKESKEEQLATLESINRRLNFIYEKHYKP